MTEQSRPPAGGYHLQMSRLLMVAVIAAIAATAALIVTVLIEMPPPGPPPPGPNGMPPPPPNMQPFAIFPIVTGFFVLSWLAVLVVFSRDQILRQLRLEHESVSQHELDAALAGLRTELAADRERELREVSERLAELTTEYGEHRETDGYLSGMRAATASEPPDANVRSFRRTPPRP